MRPAPACCASRVHWGYRRAGSAPRILDPVEIRASRPPRRDRPVLRADSRGGRLDRAGDRLGRGRARPLRDRACRHRCGRGPGAGARRAGESSRPLLRALRGRSARRQRRAAPARAPRARAAARAVTASPARLFLPDRRQALLPGVREVLELDLAICPRLGVPAERVPFSPQKVERIDEVAWFFPELRIVMRDGCQPWQALAVLLMRKYPNLSFATSRLLPSEIPDEVIAFANEARRESGAVRGGAAGRRAAGAFLQGASRNHTGAPRLAPVPARERGPDLATALSVTGRPACGSAW